MVIDLGLGDRLALLAQGLDQLDIGFTVFDRDLVMVAANRRFQQLLNFPDALCRAGTTLQDALRHNAAMGEYGPATLSSKSRSVWPWPSSFCRTASSACDPMEQSLKFAAPRWSTAAW